MEVVLWRSRIPLSKESEVVRYFIMEFPWLPKKEIYCKGKNLFIIINDHILFFFAFFFAFLNPASFNSFFTSVSNFYVTLLFPPSFLLFYLLFFFCSPYRCKPFHSLLLNFSNFIFFLENIIKFFDCFVIYAHFLPFILVPL